MHSKEPWVAHRRRLHPGREQGHVAVGLVGEARGATQDQVAFVTQRVVDARTLENARDMPDGFLVALAQAERPSGGEAQPGTPVDRGLVEMSEPVEDCGLPAPCHRVIQAALGQVVGEFPLSRGERLARGLLQQASVREPPRRAGMDLGLLFGCQRSEPGAEDLANMFAFKREFEHAYCRSRSLSCSRELHPGLMNFETWLARNASRIPVAPRIAHA